MASSMNSIPRQEVNSLLRQIQGNSLYNRQLSSICQVNGLKSTGVKADLQRRIIDLIQETVNLNDVSRFHQVRQSIANAVGQRPGTLKSSSSRGTAANSSTIPCSSGPSTSSRSRNSVWTYDIDRSASGRVPSNLTLQFKPSPFYRVETLIGGVRVCDVMTQHRNSIHIVIKLSDNPYLQRCLDDPSYRIMVFCAGDNAGVQDISFPRQSEIKVNSEEVKADLRGIKGKPGSTRPADITNALHLRSNYTNKVDFTYALTNKKYFLLINLCKVSSVPELVGTVSTRRKIPRESVVAELNAQAQDADVVATSQVMSLKCPLSGMRLEVPCRSLSCTHIQCFDATSYLQLQEQGPLWVCPICSKSAPFDQLAVDEYVRDILENTPKSLQTVTIEPNGRWSMNISRDESYSMPSGTPLGEDDEDEQYYDSDEEEEEDDGFEVSGITVVGGHPFNTPKNITPSTSTPVSGGRDSSSGAPRGGLPGSSSKRPAPAVIDLTLSSDDEEPVQRPNKRQNRGANGYRGTGYGFYSESPRNYTP